MVIIKNYKVKKYNWCVASLWDKASSMTQLISSADVSVYEFVWNEELLIQFNSTDAYVVLHILFVNFVNIKQVLLC